MRRSLEAKRAGLRARTAESCYDACRREACRSLLGGPVRAGAARRLVELVLVPREHRDELAEIFDEIDRVAGAPTLARLTAVAARATAAHTWRGARSLEASVAAISVELDRRFSACEAGEAAYPLTLSGLGAAGRHGLEHNLSSVYVAHVLERIVESALFVGTVIEPACAPGAYPVSCEPRRTTTREVRSLLAGHLARHQNATIDFALEELTSCERRDPVAVDHLQYVLLGVRGPIDVQQLVVQAHGLVLATCADLEIDWELEAAAGVLDGSGLTVAGSLALGEAIGAVMTLAAGLVSTLAGVDYAEDGGFGGDRSIGGGVLGESGELARSILRVALVVSWCARYGRVRTGVITIDDRRSPGD
jgi:hypothetical protein